MYCKRPAVATSGRSEKFAEVVVQGMGTLEQLQKLEGHTDRVWNVEWSPDGNIVTSILANQTVNPCSVQILSLPIPS